MTAPDEDEAAIQVIALYEACLNLCLPHEWHELPRAWNTKERQRFNRLAVQFFWTMHRNFPLSLPMPSAAPDDANQHMSGDLTCP